jgi:integrase
MKGNLRKLVAFLRLVIETLEWFGRFLQLNSFQDCLSTQDGNLWLEMKMQKTKNSIRIPLYLLHNGKPIELLNAHRRAEYKYFFDELTNQYVNRCLKEIAALAGVTKKVTFHTARHTCATFLLYKGVAITTVQKILGHKKLAVTQIYAKQMDMTMVNELSGVQSW